MKPKFIKVLVLLFFFIAVCFVVFWLNLPSIKPTAVMYPTLETHKSYKIWPNRNPKRGDLVVFKSQNKNSGSIEYKISRLIAFENETVSIDAMQHQTGVSINGVFLEEPYVNQFEISSFQYGPVTVNLNHIFVMVDLRNPHIFHEIPKSDIVGIIKK